MKRLLAVLIACLLIAGCAFCEETESLQSKYEESVVFDALKTLCRCATDDLNKWACTKSVRKDSSAYKKITSYDAGWFGKVRKREYLEFSSANWTEPDENSFECDVFGINRITYTYGNLVKDYSLAYHMRFERTSAAKNDWLLTEFSNLPLETDAALALRVTNEYEGLSLYTVTGGCYRGFMLVIDDPSRVFVGTIDTFSSTAEGKLIDVLAAKYSALAAINGGGFEDGDKSTGGKPTGLVISQGVQKSNNNPYSDTGKVIMGFDTNDKLIVGTFKNDEIEGLNLRDALAFNRALIINGEAQSADKAQYTTRTAIGQDGEGRVLMLVVEGRQPDSLGASFEDEIEIMLSFGAVNAGNLDGGNSSVMYLDGENIYGGYPHAVSRRMPAAFMVSDIN